MFHRALLLGVIVLQPTLCFAEVSDKIPTITFYWVEALSLVLLLSASPAVRWWLPIAILPFSLLAIGLTLDVVTDPYVQPAAQLEQGWQYTAHALGTLTLIAVFQLIALIVGLRKIRR